MILKQQLELTFLQENVWESKYPSFLIYYDNDIISRYVSSRMVKTSGLEEYIKNIVREAKSEYKDVVFYKYNKWETSENNDPPLTFVRYCLIEREI